MRISYWSSDVCSSDLPSRQRNRPCCLQLGIFRSQTPRSPPPSAARTAGSRASLGLFGGLLGIRAVGVLEHMHEARNRIPARSEEQTSELQSLMRTSYAFFGLKTIRKKPNR